VCVVFIYSLFLVTFLHSTNPYVYRITCNWNPYSASNYLYHPINEKLGIMSMSQSSIRFE